MSSSKINFSLGKKNKKPSIKSTEEDPSTSKKRRRKGDFFDDDPENTTKRELAEEARIARQKGLSAPLVIPLIELPLNDAALLAKNNASDEATTVENGNNDAASILKQEQEGKDTTHIKKEEEDNQAILALEADAAENVHNKSQSKTASGSTNFSADGSLVIKQEENEDLGCNKNSENNNGGASNSTNTATISKENKKKLPLLLANRLTYHTTTDDNDKDENPNETKLFQRDLSLRPNDIAAESDTYVTVPVSEFGAAMLRGMGWKNKTISADDDNNKKKNQPEDDMAKPRHHRLGLGAVPRPLSLSTTKNKTNSVGGRHRARKPGQHLQHQKAREEENEKLSNKKVQDAKLIDKQLTLQIGSVVHLRSQNNQRAVMVKIAGVPGLNQVLVCVEGHDTNDNLSVKKGDAILATQEDLDQNPFQFTNKEKKEGKSSCEKKNNGDEKRYNNKDPEMELVPVKKEGDEGEGFDRHNRDYERNGPSSSLSKKRYHDSDKYDRDRGRDKGRDRDRGDRDKDRDRERDDRDKGKDRDRGGKDRGRDGRDKGKDRDRGSRDKSRDRDKRRDRSRDRDTHHHHHNKETQERQTKDKYSHANNHQSSQHWVIPNIRVRIISKKHYPQYFKQKGVVLDVLKPGECIIQMDIDGQILEHVKERYLETALPKVGSNGNQHVVVLTSDHGRDNMHAKGKLLEKCAGNYNHNDLGMGVVQIGEDLRVLKLSLDDIAEWCGPL